MKISFELRYEKKNIYQNTLIERIELKIELSLYSNISYTLSIHFITILFVNKFAFISDPRNTF